MKKPAKLPFIDDQGRQLLPPGWFSQPPPCCCDDVRRDAIRLRRSATSLRLRLVRVERRVDQVCVEIDHLAAVALDAAERGDLPVAVDTLRELALVLRPMVETSPAGEGARQ